MLLLFVCLSRLARAQEVVPPDAPDEALARAEPPPEPVTVVPIVAPRQSPYRRFRFGQLQLAAGLGIQAVGYRLSLWPLVEGWHPASAQADLGVLDLGAFSVSLGVETSIATQLLVNPMLRLRERFGFLPWFPGAGLEADYRWRAVNWRRGGRLAVHLTKLKGVPFVLIGVHQDVYGIRATSREDPSTTGRFQTVLTSASIGAGATSMLPSGFLVTAEVRYFQRILEFGQQWSVPLGESGITVVRRMQPAPVILRASVGYRFGGAYRDRE
jgi:hypothetical protein